MSLSSWKVNLHLHCHQGSRNNWMSKTKCRRNPRSTIQIAPKKILNLQMQLSNLIISIIKTTISQTKTVTCAIRTILIKINTISKPTPPLTKKDTNFNSIFDSISNFQSTAEANIGLKNKNKNKQTSEQRECRIPNRTTRTNNWRYDPHLRRLNRAQSIARGCCFLPSSRRWRKNWTQWVRVRNAGGLVLC